MTRAHGDFDLLFSRTAISDGGVIHIGRQSVDARVLGLGESVRRLAPILYERVYTRPAEMAAIGSREDAVEAGRELQELWPRAPTWSYGWRVREVREESLLVQRGLEVRECAHGNYVYDRLPSDAAGERCVDLRDVSQYAGIGHWIGYGAAHFVPASTALTIRLYGNFGLTGRVCATRVVAEAMRRAEVACVVKVLLSDFDDPRADGWVLYAHAADAAWVAQIVDALSRCIEIDSHGRPPLLTEVMASGLGLADDPAGGMSFGVSRCKMIAQGLARAAASMQRSAKSVRAAVYREFRTRGVSTARPYTAFKVSAADLVREHSPRRCCTAHVHRTLERCETGEVVSGQSVLLQAAARIGAELCRAARWSGDMCTWWTCDWSDTASGVRAGTLSANLFSGTAGVGLSLASIYQCSGDESCRVHARAALLHAARRTLAHEWRPHGFYSGALGVAYALSVAAQALDDSELAELAAQIGQRAADAPIQSEASDVMAGNAGSVLGLLAMARATGRREFVEAAVARGVALCSAAVRTDAGAYWNCYPRSGARGPLVGMAHGGSGVALALAELSNAVERPEFASMAHDAARLEHALYDSRGGNWPDLRAVTERVPDRGGSEMCLESWCNGAAGVALARARLVEILGGDELRADLLRGAKLSAQRFRVPSADWSLCHGEFGRIEAVRRASCHARGGADVALAVARAAEGAVTYGLVDRPWPCGGTPTVPVVGLMTGVAGIAYGLVRSAGVSTPSILLPLDN